MFYITSVSLVNCTNLHALCLTGCTWLQSLDCPVPTTHISCCYSIKKYDLFHIWGSYEHNAHLSLYFQLINSDWQWMQTSPPIYFFLVTMSLKRYCTQRHGFLQMHTPMVAVNQKCTKMNLYITTHPLLESICRYHKPLIISSLEPICWSLF